MTDPVEEPDLEQLGAGLTFREELYRMLEHTQLLKDFSHADIEQLAPYTGAYMARKGTRIFTEGTKGTFLALLVDGQVAIIKEGKKITTIKKGKTLGEMSVIDGYSHSASAVATEDTRFIMITRGQLERMTENHPKLAVHLVWQLSKLISLRLRQTTGILCEYLN